jgi:hypothetical protein
MVNSASVLLCIKVRAREPIQASFQFSPSWMTDRSSCKWIFIVFFNNLSFVLDAHYCFKTPTIIVTLLEFYVDFLKRGITSQLLDLKMESFLYGITDICTSTRVFSTKENSLRLQLDLQENINTGNTITSIHTR